jgi:hypothetical protein
MMVIINDDHYNPGNGSLQPRWHYKWWNDGLYEGSPPDLRGGWPEPEGESGTKPYETHIDS